MSEQAFPPAPEQPKKKGKGKIVLIILGILVVLCIGGGFAAYKFLGAAVDLAYSEGKCVDILPTGAVAETKVPKPVECSSSEAKGKILKVADDKKITDAEAVCGSVPGFEGAIQISLTSGSTKLLCLGAK